MPSRRSHTKTRHGCVVCKARKKRCDLERPICQNCVRTGHECSYTNQVPAAGKPWYNHNGSSSSSSSSLSPPWLLKEGKLPSPLLPSSQFEALKLMHHYTALTSLSMTENLAHHHIWQLIVPPLAFSHPFLLHGILSLSALHYHYDAKPEERTAFVNMAREHQQAALSVYIGHLQNINENNCHAMFAYSITLGGICYAFIRERQKGPEKDDIVELIIAAFDTLIGATAVAVHAREWLHRGSLKPLMTPLPSYDECLARLSPAYRVVIDHLLHSLPALGTVVQSVEEPVTEESQAIYTTAIRALTVAFPHADGGLSSVSEVVSWPIMAGTEYLMLLKKQDSFALLILAYYGVALHYCNRSWFLQGSGKRLVLAISGKIANPWLVHIDWAKRQVLAEAGTDPSLLIHDVKMSP